MAQRSNSRARSGSSRASSSRSRSSRSASSHSKSGSGRSRTRSGNTRSQSSRSSTSRASGRSRSSARGESRTRNSSSKRNRSSHSRRTSSSRGRSASARSGGNRSRSASSSRSSVGSHVLTDHDEIRQWAEHRNATPSCVRGTGAGEDVGMIRLDFPGFSGEGSLEPIEWDEWFQKFDENGLALLVQETTSRGARSNFNKLVKHETAQNAGKRSARGSRGSSQRRAA